MAYFIYKIDLLTEIFAPGQIIYRIWTYPDTPNIPILLHSWVSTIESPLYSNLEGILGINSDIEGLEVDRSRWFGSIKRNLGGLRGI